MKLHGNAALSLRGRERVVAEHRQWYYELARRGFVEAGHLRPGNAAHHNATAP